MHAKSLTYIEIDTEPFDVMSPMGDDVTWRFAEPTDYLQEAGIDAIPSIKAVGYTPATISLGKDLGQRASINVALGDHLHSFDGEPYDQGSFFGKWRARYGTRLRGRAFRLIRGFVGQALGEMDTRHFVIDSTDGPTPDGTYTIVAKDILKLADDDRAQAPMMSEGRLAGSIDAVAVAATLGPDGVGDEAYPASGHICFGGKEIVAYTRSGDSLTITRGQFGTTAIAHTAGDRAQLVLYYDGDDVADIIADLLINYAGVPSEYIPLGDWQAETDAHLSVIYARPITEPTSVNKLVSGLVEQAALVLWWDEQAALVRLQVLREIATDADTFGEDRILQGSLKVKEQPDKRISRIWTHFGQRNPADRSDNEDNYRAQLVSVDLDREEDYGSAEIRKIKGSWLATLSAAQRLNGIQLSRFKNPPRKFAFDLFRGETVTPAGGYRLEWRKNQTVTGAEAAGVPIQITRVAIEPGRIKVEAEEMLASGVIVVTDTVFLTTTGGVLEWEVPADWNDDDNSIHCISAGGGGARGSTSNEGPGGQGGGGGAYSRADNVQLLGSPSPSLQYRVGTAGNGQTPSSAATDGGDTWFGGATFGAAAVAAEGGQRGIGQSSGGRGGRASQGIGDVRNSGGDGGDGDVSGGENQGGGGGGAAAGPNGDGGDGGTAIGGDGRGGGGANGGANGGSPSGGNNRFGFGGGTTSDPNGKEGGGGAGSTGGNDAGAGSAEIIWTQTVAPIIAAGPGAGGGGSRDQRTAVTGRGAAYGGGGGGTGRQKNVSGSAGDGAQGIVVITWKPAA